MTGPKDKDVEQQQDATGVQHAAGRVEIDSRGNSVWKWAKDMIDSTSILLKRLENKDLALEPTQKVPVIGGGKAAKADKAGNSGTPGKSPKGGARPALGVAERTGGGFDPYNSRR